jgi:hypothetical protein
MVDCRYKRNKTKKVCKGKKKKKGKKKYSQKQSQRQTVNIHIHQKKTKRKTRKHPYIPRVNAAAASIPLVINTNPPRSFNEYQLNILKNEFAKQEQKIDNLFEFNKIKYGENLAMKQKIQQLQEELPKALAKREEFVREEEREFGRQIGIEEAQKKEKEKRSKAAKKGAETRKRKKEKSKEPQPPSEPQPNIKSPRNN